MTVNRDADRPSRLLPRPSAVLRERLSSSHPGTQLAAVSVPIILLLTAAALAFAWRGYERAAETAGRESQLMATTAAVDAERFLANRVEMLGAISSAPLLARGNLTEIHDYLSAIVGTTGFSEIGWIDTNGYAQTVGGAPPLAAPLYTGDRAHVAKALKTGMPAIGAAQISRVSREPTVNVVVPVKTGDRVAALIAGAVRLNGPKITDLRFGNVEGLRVIDGQGNLAVIGEQQGLRELRNVGSWPEYAAVRAAPEGVIRADTGVLGGPDRIIGFAAVPGSDWVVLVDRPQTAVFAEALRTLRIEVALAVVFAASSLLLVTWAAVRLDAGAQRFGLFIDTLTHDVGTPLTVIRAYSSRLQRALRDEPTLLSGVVEIDRAGRRIERMVQSLSDLLGPGGHAELVRREVDLVPLVRGIVAEYEVRTARSIRYEHSQPSIIGEWDGLRVERVVDNLLSNAIKYSAPPTDILVQLTIEQGGAGRQVVIEVRDFGIGIPQAEQSAIWRRFRRGSNTGSVSGKGIGLAIVRQIAEEHGGSVHLMSSAGRGTVVTVRLPWAEDEAPDVPADSEDPDGEPTDVSSTATARSTSEFARR